MKCFFVKIFFGATMVENPATRPSAKQILEILEVGHYFNISMVTSFNAKFNKLYGQTNIYK